MTTPSNKGASGKPAAALSAKEQKLAEALRRNLRLRKDAAKEARRQDAASPEQHSAKSAAGLDETPEEA